MTSVFARELNALIRKHLGKPRHGDDYLPVINALRVAADRLAMKADHRPWKDDDRTVADRDTFG